MDESSFGLECGSLPLDNGLTITFYDQSRPVAGDRMLVQLLIRIPISMHDTYFSDCGDPPDVFRAFIQQENSQLVFTQTKTRNFINREESQSVLDALKDEFLQTGLSYLSKPAFPKLYVMKRYEDWKTASSWRDAYKKHLDRTEQKERESE